MSETVTPANDEYNAHKEELQGVFRRISIFFGEFNPTGNLSFTYLTEGAANVVWKVRFTNSNLDHQDGSVVLRMRKDIPSTVSMVELKRQFEERIAPLFLFDPSLLLPVQLIQLCPSIIDQLNQDLLHLEATDQRRSLRLNVYHPLYTVEPYGMLMPNLGFGPGQIVEFKPKWLVQSPSAPRNAQRCRTCALNTRRRVNGGTGRGDSGFCPFDLLSRNTEILRNALSQVWPDDSTLLGFVEAFRNKVQPALRQMQKLQRMHNEVGLSDFSAPSGKDFSVAMALRDCSVLLRAYKPDDTSQLDINLIKLLDLDLKETGGGKLEKWARMESELIDEGWYTSTYDSGLKCAMKFQ